VNIASRIQHQANPAEINVTTDIYETTRLTDAIKGFQVDPIKARLKGIQDETQIYRIYKN